jgi:alpha-glucoside transport system substrate-binding protein
MRKLKWLALIAVFALVVAACGDDDEGGTTTAGDGGDGGGGEVTGEVAVFGAFSGIEAQAVSTVIDNEINAKRSYSATYEGSDSFEEQIKIRVEGGNPPDVALYPQPGAVVEQAELGNAIALEDLGYDIAELEAVFGEYLLSLAEVDGKHYGLPTNVNSKSLIWYPLPAFTDAGYEEPATWDELIALSDQIVADGNTPWCIGIGSDAATGWPATDWMEDIMLRTAGAEKYDQWVTHDLLFSSPEVTRAATLLGDVVFADGYVLGGAENIPDIDFRDAPDPMFNDPPSCYLHRQASFITTFFDAPDGRTLEFGTDYGVFAFPDIDEGVKGALGAGELAAVFNDTPAVRAFLEDFTSVDVQCAQGSIDERIGRISPNTGVGPECYTNEILAVSAQAIVDALKTGGFRFDASDLMPTAVGSGSFWTGMNEYMRQGPEALAGILEDIDASWP